MYQKRRQIRNVKSSSINRQTSKQSLQKQFLQTNPDEEGNQILFTVDDPDPNDGREMNALYENFFESPKQSLADIKKSVDKNTMKGQLGFKNSKNVELCPWSSTDQDQSEIVHINMLKQIGKETENMNYEGSDYLASTTAQSKSNNNFIQNFSKTSGTLNGSLKYQRPSTQECQNRINRKSPLNSELNFQRYNSNNFFQDIEYSSPVLEPKTIVLATEPDLFFNNNHRSLKIEKQKPTVSYLDMLRVQIKKHLNDKINQLGKPNSNSHLQNSNNHNNTANYNNNINNNSMISQNQNYNFNNSSVNSNNKPITASIYKRSNEICQGRNFDMQAIPMKYQYEVIKPDLQSQSIQMIEQPVHGNSSKVVFHSVSNSGGQYLIVSEQQQPQPQQLGNTENEKLKQSQTEPSQMDPNKITRESPFQPYKNQIAIANLHSSNKTNKNYNISILQSKQRSDPNLNLQDSYTNLSDNQVQQEKISQARDKSTSINLNDCTQFSFVQIAVADDKIKQLKENFYNNSPIFIQKECFRINGNSISKAKHATSSSQCYTNQNNSQENSFLDETRDNEKRTQSKDFYTTVMPKKQHNNSVSGLSPSKKIPTVKDFRNDGGIFKMNYESKYFHNRSCFRDFVQQSGANKPQGSTQKIMIINKSQNLVDLQSAQEFLNIQQQNMSQKSIAITEKNQSYIFADPHGITNDNMTYIANHSTNISNYSQSQEEDSPVQNQNIEGEFNRYVFVPKKSSKAYLNYSHLINSKIPNNVNVSQREYQLI